MSLRRARPLLLLPLVATLFHARHSHAQGLPDRLGVGTPPPGTVATVDESHAVAINPAGLGFMEGPQLMVAHSGLDFVGPTGASDSIWGGMRFLDRVSIAGGADWIRPPMQLFTLPNFAGNVPNVLPLLGSSVLRLSVAGAFRLTEEISFGAAYRHIFGSTRRLYNLGTIDLGVTLRPFRYLALGATLEQANSPFAGNDRMLRSIRLGFAVRPILERLTFSVETRLDEVLRLDTNMLTRLEVLPGISFFANAWWLDILAGAGQAGYSVVKEGAYTNAPFIRDLAGGVGVASAQRIGIGGGLQIDMEHFGAGFVGTWTPGSGFLQPRPPAIPNPLTGGYGTLGGATVYARASMERYPSMIQLGSRAIEVEVKGDLGKPTPDNPFESLMDTLSGNEGPGETIALLDRAANDRRVRIVYLRIKALSVGWGRIVEVRQRVEALRKAGKRVIAYLDSGGDEEYHIASAADRIYLAPSGQLALDGFSVIIQFVAAALDRVGIHVEAISAGKYKSAPEQLTRSEPSEANKEVQAAILDGLYETHVAAISRNRAIPPDRVKAILDRGLTSAQEALEERLVDSLAYSDEIPGVANKDLGLGSGKLSFNDRYGREDFRYWRWARPKAIGVVTIQGDIKQGKSGIGPGITGGGGAAADDIVEALGAAAEDDDVKAVVLRVESPGGDSLASDLIWNAVQRLRREKPVIASFGDLAASGGYYAAAGCDMILAEPTTLTGSIGVFAVTFEAKDLMDRFGITTYEDTRGKMAGNGWHRPLTDNERTTIQKFVNGTYELFLKRVKDGRKMDMEKVRELAQGRVWTGAEAKRIGLVDELGGMAEAIQFAKARVGLGRDSTVEVRLITGKDDPVTRWSSALNVTARYFSGEKRREDQLRNAVKLLLGDPDAVDRAVWARNSKALAMMPYTVTIK